MNQLHLEKSNDPIHFAPVRRTMEAFCAMCGFDESAIGDIGLCINEAMANITRHAYRGAIGQPVHLDARFADGQIEVTLRDWGVGKDPSLTPPKTDPLVPGGLGMVCLRSLMDDIKFEPQPDGMLLRMKRSLR